MEKRNAPNRIPNNEDTANYVRAMPIKWKKSEVSATAVPTSRALLMLQDNDVIVSSLQTAAVDDDPANWELQAVSAENFANAVSALVIETFASSAILAKTSTKCHKVAILEDAQFGSSNVLAKIEKLPPDFLNEIHVLSHGGNNVIHSVDNARSPILTTTNFFVPLHQTRLNGTIPLRLRAV